MVSQADKKGGGGQNNKTIKKMAVLGAKARRREAAKIDVKT
jgi:hypothetical protein